MSVRWTRNGAAAAIAGFAGFALGFTGGVSIAIGLLAFAVLCGLDYTAVARVQRKDREDR
ncbi:MAG: hypothetical protein NXI12_10705 [Alphaproteobacteria bacterium]|nr:hypothetical protein [Alphaproteobacteria bacterium]